MIKKDIDNAYNITTEQHVICVALTLNFINLLYEIFPRTLKH